MNQELLDKAIDLNDKIKYCELSYNRLDNFLKELTDHKVLSLEFRFRKKEEYTSVQKLELIYNQDESFKEELNCCGMIVATYMKEVILKKTIRLKEEYKNI